MTQKELNDSHASDLTVIDRKPETSIKLQRPRMWKVLILNDDFTPMEFVVTILMEYFSKTIEEATDITLQVHKKGVGLAGVYTHEIADTKLGFIASAARNNEFPLRATIEPTDST